MTRSRFPNRRSPTSVVVSTNSVEEDAYVETVRPTRKATLVWNGRVRTLVLFVFCSIISLLGLVEYRAVVHHQRQVDSMMKNLIASDVSGSNHDLRVKLPSQGNENIMVDSSYHALVARHNRNNNININNNNSVTSEKLKFQQQEEDIVTSDHHTIRSNESEVSDETPSSSSRTTRTNVTTKTTRRARKRNHTRFIVGIMSHSLSETEIQRRTRIRNTYLSFYSSQEYQRTFTQDGHNMTQKERNEDFERNQHLICSLNDLKHGRVKYPDKCRLAYAFVLGANPKGTTLLLDYNESYPLTVPPPTMATDANTREFDAVYLNIKENGDMGKTPTWFRYATSLVEEKGWTDQWDFILKTDSDSMILVHELLNFIDSKQDLHPPIREVYGGRMMRHTACGGDEHDHCNWLKGDDDKYFMGGSLYYLSLDLAAFVGKPSTVKLGDCAETPHEDMLTGRALSKHPRAKQIRAIDSPDYEYFWHPLRSDDQYYMAWKIFLETWTKRPTDDQYYMAWQTFLETWTKRPTQEK